MEPWKYYDENLPCNKKKCDPTTRASCCGCPEYFEYMKKKEQKESCEYCMNGRALATGKSDAKGSTDYGISIWINDHGADLLAYGYNPKGDGGNTIRVKIKYCPMCGRDFTK